MSCLFFSLFPHDALPILGLLTVNALACSHGVIIPMECEFFSLRGLALLTDTVEKVAERINFDLEVIGILVTMFDRRTKHGDQKDRKSTRLNSSHVAISYG